MFLTGHLHVGYAGETAVRYKGGGRVAIVVEAGTAASTRRRGEPNSFNVLRAVAGRITVERRTWNEIARAIRAGRLNVLPPLWRRMGEANRERRS